MNNFCPQPWVGLDISAQGEFKPCCKFNKTISNNIEDYKNSQLLQEVKDYHQKNIRHEGCKRCWDDEDAGIRSKRQLDNQYVFRKKFINIFTSRIRLLGMTFGNTCNLACRTCGTIASSRWLQEIKKHGNFNNQTVYNHSKFYKNDGFMNDLVDLIDDNIHIDIAGGEPLLSGTQEHINFIQNLSDKGKNITLHYTTNCTNYPSNDILTLWSKFNKIDIQFSIDGIGNKANYIRWPSDWDIVYSNIKKYQEYQKQNSNIQISISHTLSILNILDLPNFIDWCEKESLPKPYIGMVSKPGEYNIKSLPPSVKEQIKNKKKDAKTID